MTIPASFDLNNKTKTLAQIVPAKSNLNKTTTQAEIVFDLNDETTTLI